MSSDSRTCLNERWKVEASVNMITHWHSQCIISICSNEVCSNGVDIALELMSSSDSLVGQVFV